MSDTGQPERMWTLGFHEDNLFHTRLQIFLTAHALLLAPVGFLLSRPTAPRTFLIGLAALGVVLGAIWLIVQVRARAVIQRIEDELAPDPVYQKVFPQRGRSRWSQSAVLAVLLPGLVVAAWLALGLAFCFGWV
jgi:uncharacterized membrane protein YciS (DUF1049 family)